MAGYGSNYRSGCPNGKEGGPHANEWNKTSYADNECRTIIVGADGTRRIIIGCDPLYKPGTYVTKTETIIRERILSPGNEYGYADDLRRPSSPAKGYGYAADDYKLRRPSSPVKGYGYAPADHKVHRPSSPPKSYGYAVGDHYPRRPSSPTKSYAVGDHYPHKPSSPVKSYGYSADHPQLHRPSSPEDDYPGEVGDFLTKVQTDASRDQRANWHQPPPKAAHNGTYGDYSDYNNKTSYKPNGNTIRDDNHDDYGRKYYSDMGPNTVTNGGHQPRPSRPAWTPPPTVTNGGHQPRPSSPAWTPPPSSPAAWTPPPSREGRLSSATDDIDTVLRLLKESAVSSSATTTAPQYPQYPTVPKRDQYPTDAAKRNARFRP